MWQQCRCISQHKKFYLYICVKYILQSTMKIAFYHPKLVLSKSRLVVSSSRSSRLQRALPIQNDSLPLLNPFLDDTLSQRSLSLDPAGYFVIKIEPTSVEPIVAEYYTNTINKDGKSSTCAIHHPTRNIH